MTEPSFTNPSLNEFARSSKGAGEFVSAFTGEAADLFDYMTQSGMSGQHSADLINEMIRKVLAGRLVTMLNQAETTPSTPDALMARQEELAI